MVDSKLYSDARASERSTERGGAPREIAGAAAMSQDVFLERRLFMKKRHLGAE